MMFHVDPTMEQLGVAVCSNTHRDGITMVRTSFLSLVSSVSMFLSIFYKQIENSDILTMNLSLSDLNTRTLFTLTPPPRAAPCVFTNVSLTDP